MGGLGATTYYLSSPEQSRSMTRFSFALGGGVKYRVNQLWGLRAEARWAPTVLKPVNSSFWCSVGGAGAQCLIRFEAPLHHQVDLTGGVFFRF
jgi:hypothetical protein